MKQRQKKTYVVRKQGHLSNYYKYTQFSQMLKETTNIIRKSGNGLAKISQLKKKKRNKGKLDFIKFKNAIF